MIIKHIEKSLNLAHSLNDNLPHFGEWKDNVRFALYCAENCLSYASDEIQKKYRICIYLIKKWLNDSKSVKPRRLLNSVPVLCSNSTIVRNAVHSTVENAVYSTVGKVRCSSFPSDIDCLGRNINFMPCDNGLNEKISNLIDKYGFQSVLESVSNKGEAESSIAEGEDRKDAALKLYFLAKQVRYLSEEFSNEKI